MHSRGDVPFFRRMTDRIRSRGNPLPLPPRHYSPGLRQNPQLHRFARLTTDARRSHHPRMVDPSTCTALMQAMSEPHRRGAMAAPKAYELMTGARACKNPATLRFRHGAHEQEKAVLCCPFLVC